MSKYITGENGQIHLRILSRVVVLVVVVVGQLISPAEKCWLPIGLLPQSIITEKQGREHPGCGEN